MMLSRIFSATIVRLGVRSIFGRWRGVLLIVLPVLLVGISLLVRVLVGEDDNAAEGTLYGLGLVVIVPLVALLAMSGLLAPEIDDGSISYLLAKPISRHTIVASKLVVAVACVLVFGALPMVAAGLVLLTELAVVRRRVRPGVAGRRCGVLRDLRAAVGDDAARRGHRPDLPAGVGRAARRPARRHPLAEHHPLVGRAHRPDR